MLIEYNNIHSKNNLTVILLVLNTPIYYSQIIFRAYILVSNDNTLYIGQEIYDNVLEPSLYLQLKYTKYLSDFVGIESINCLVLYVNILRSMFPRTNTSLISNVINKLKFYRSWAT